MKSKSLVGVRDIVGRISQEELRLNQLRGDLMFGDVIWVKVNGCTWWPGQVVDENNVSDSLKPQNKVAGEVLVRLYGSYQYLYVDSTKSRAGFENILKGNNGSYSETFGKALEQELCGIKSAEELKGGSKPRGKPPGLEASKVEKLKLHGTRTQEADVPSVVRLSPRRQHDIKISTGRVKGGAREEESKKIGSPKQKLAQKKLQPKSSNSVRVSPRRQPDTIKTPGKAKSGKLTSRNDRKEASKSDNLKQDIKKILKFNSQNFARGSPRSQQDSSKTQKRVRSGELMSRKVGKGASENDIPEQHLVLKKQRPSSPDCVLEKSEKSQDFSERRTKVKLSLGLMAPCGSPFHRNGLALPSNLLATP